MRSDKLNINGEIVLFLLWINMVQFT